MAFLFWDCWRRRIASMLNNVFLRISSLDLDVLKYFMAFFLSLVEIFLPSKKPSFFYDLERDLGFSLSFIFSSELLKNFLFRESVLLDSCLSLFFSAILYHHFFPLKEKGMQCMANLSLDSRAPLRVHVS